MTPDRRLLAGLLGLVAVVAACGSTIELQATYEPTAQPTPQSGQSARPVVQPTAGASGFGNNTTPPGAPVLEKQLPSQVGPETFTKSSYNGAVQGLGGAPFTATKLEPFLKDNGKTLKDVGWAVGRGSAGSTVMAIEVAAVDAKLTMAVLGPAAADLRDAAVGSKTVKRGGAPGFWVVLYPKDDMLFWVQCPEAAQLDAILAALP